MVKQYESWRLLTLLWYLICLPCCELPLSRLLIPPHGWNEVRALLRSTSISRNAAQSTVRLNSIINFITGRASFNHTMWCEACRDRMSKNISFMKYQRAARTWIWEKFPQTESDIIDSSKHDDWETLFTVLPDRCYADRTQLWPGPTTGADISSGGRIECPQSTVRIKNIL